MNELNATDLDTILTNIAKKQIKEQKLEYILIKNITKTIESPRFKRQIRQQLHKQDKVLPDLRHDISHYVERVIEEIETKLNLSMSPNRYLRR